MINSQLIGEKHGQNVTLSLSPWPSDHRAIVSHFKVRASYFPIQHMKLFPIRGEYSAKNLGLWYLKSTKIGRTH